MKRLEQIADDIRDGNATDLDNNVLLDEIAEILPLALPLARDVLARKLKILDKALSNKKGTDTSKAMKKIERDVLKGVHDRIAKLIKEC